MLTLLEMKITYKFSTSKPKLCNKTPSVTLKWQVLVRRKIFNARADVMCHRVHRTKWERLSPVITSPRTRADSDSTG